MYLYIIEKLVFIKLVPNLIENWSFNSPYLELNGPKFRFRGGLVLEALHWKGCSFVSTYLTALIAQRIRRGAFCI